MGPRQRGFTIGCSGRSRRFTDSTVARPSFETRLPAKTGFPSTRARSSARASARVGVQCIVVAIDAKRRDGSWEVYTHGGRRPTGMDAIEWAVRVEQLGAGEILLTSMDCDGTKDGYDVPLTRAVAEAVGIPVIASGGAGTLEHLREALVEGKADAVLAASIFHYGEYSVSEAKAYLREHGIEVRT